MPLVSWQPLNLLGAVSVWSDPSHMSCNTECIWWRAFSASCPSRWSLFSSCHVLTSSQVLFRGNWFICTCIFVVSMKGVWSRNFSLLISPEVRLVKAMVFLWSCMDVRVGLWRRLSTKELMLLNCGVGEDSWESLGLQGDPTSHFWRRSALGFLWK